MIERFQKFLSAKIFLEEEGFIYNLDSGQKFPLPKKGSKFGKPEDDFILFDDIWGCDSQYSLRNGKLHPGIEWATAEFYSVRKDKEGKLISLIHEKNQEIGEEKQTWFDIHSDSQNEVDNKKIHFKNSFEFDQNCPFVYNPESEEIFLASNRLIYKFLPLQGKLHNPEYNQIYCSESPGGLSVGDISIDGKWIISLDEDREGEFIIYHWEERINHEKNILFEFAEDLMRGNLSLENILEIEDYNGRIKQFNGKFLGKFSRLIADYREDKPQEILHLPGYTLDEFESFWISYFRNQGKITEVDSIDIERKIETAKYFNVPF